MTIKGVYVGNSTTELQQFENWLGAEVDAVHGVVGYANWTDFTNSAKWMTNTLWKGINEEILWSVPIIVNDGSSSLAKAATGAYDGYYRQVAQTLLASRAGDSDPIYVRTGWEANGDWFFWNAIGKEAAFKGAFQHFADAFHGVSKFVMRVKCGMLAWVALLASMRGDIARRRRTGRTRARASRISARMR